MGIHFLVKSEKILVPNGAEWRYLDSGTFPGSNWKSIGFDDQSWSAGFAPLGYGMNGAASLISFGADPTNKHITTWFRKSFEVQKVDQFGKLKFRARRDDGIVVYVNGIEAFRDNMPEGIISSQTLALTAVTGHSQDEFLEIILPFEAFSPGKNCVAVEVHQANAQSSDLIFDFEMVGEIFTLPIFNKQSSWRYLATATSLTQSWRNLYFSDGNWPFGSGILGYGNGNEATVLDFGPDPENKFTTTYFRKSFFVLPGQKQKLYMGRVLVDDGCIVYVNGVEVYRFNMPDGLVTYQTHSKSAISGPDELVYRAFAFDSNLVVFGLNSIAVEVHQSHPSSTDLAFDLSLEGQRIFGGELVRGPYLQSVSPNQAIIRWRTSRAVPSVLRYGKLLNSPSDSLIDLVPKTEHELKLPNLQPSTIYYYQLSDGYLNLTEVSENQYVKTNPTLDSKNSFRVWVLGDQGSMDQGQQNVRNSFYSKNGGPHVDLVLTLGDNAYDGFDENFQKALFETYPKTLQNSPIWPGFGNHEAYGGANSMLQSGPFYDIFSLPINGECGGKPSGTEAYYSFNFGNSHFIHLNSNDVPSDSTGAMAQWLKADLGQNQQMWTIVYWHHPAYSFGTHISDIDSNMTRMRTQINPILERFGVDLVLSGHSHVYERSFPIRGHFGPSSSFLPEMKVSNQLGRYPADCGFTRKKIGEGTIYVTCGGSGQLGWGPLGYPSTAVGLIERGSLVLDIYPNQLSLHYLGDQGLYLDSMVLFKEVGNRQGLEKCPAKTEKLSASWTGKYFWNTGEEVQSINITQEQPGNYSYIVQDGFGCLSDTFDVSVLVVPKLDLGNDTLLVTGETLSLSTSIPGQYLWSTGETGTQIVAFPNGIYWLQITLTNGCQISDTIKTGIFSQTKMWKSRTMDGILVYPNPTCNDLNFRILDSKNLIRSFSVTDPTGQPFSDFQVRFFNAVSGRFLIKRPGIYFIRFERQNGAFETIKVGIQ